MLLLWRIWLLKVIFLEAAPKMSFCIHNLSLCYRREHKWKCSFSKLCYPQLIEFVPYIIRSMGTQALCSIHLVLLRRKVLMLWNQTHDLLLRRTVQYQFIPYMMSFMIRPMGTIALRSIHLVLLWRKDGLSLSKLGILLFFFFVWWVLYLRYCCQTLNNGNRTDKKESRRL